MKGARELCKLFKTGQYGRFYIVNSSHARGDTFKIQLLPEEEKAERNFNNLCLNSDAVLIYGVISGNPGWTETYGWLHIGKWVDDFNEMVKIRKIELEAEERARIKFQEQKIAKEKERTLSLLKNY